MDGCGWSNRNGDYLVVLLKEVKTTMFYVAVAVIVIAWFAYDLAKKIWAKECGCKKDCCRDHKDKIEL